MRRRFDWISRSWLRPALKELKGGGGRRRYSITISQISKSCIQLHTKMIYIIMRK